MSHAALFAEVPSISFSPVKPLKKSIGRIKFTRLAAIPFFGLLLVTDDSWAAHNPAEKLMLSAGALLVLAAITGRLWCTLYIGGRKTSKLIMHGPYSLCRNPLYFCSALGVTGLAATTGMASLVALVAVAFALYYPTVIAKEEVVLTQVHGDDFRAYCKATPRFWLSFKGFHEPESGEFRPEFLYRAIGDAAAFVLIWALIAGIHCGHDAGVLPVWFRLY